jgi:radical SAM protein with 4Fe4S-binding SPASM domain
VVDLVSAVQNRLQGLLGKKDFNGVKFPSPGVYHYRLQNDNERSRAHLRIDEDRSGTFIINASRVFHLNPTATQMAYFFMEKYQPEAAVRALRRIYDSSPSRLHEDYTQLIAQIRELLRPDGACPLHELDFEITPPFHNQPSAPYRMDLALTYRCNNDCSHCYNARPRDFAELDTSYWFRILDALWDIGVPHVVFTGGEPTLRNDLPLLIAHAEQNGQITGINTNGRRLTDPHFLEAIINAGLDHIQITLESHDPIVHDQMVRSKGAWAQTVRGIQNATQTHLYIMTNTTLLRDNAPGLKDTMDFLADLNVRTVGLNALIYSGHGLEVNTGLEESELQHLLTLAREKTELAGQRLIWYTPTQYCHFDPVQLDLGVKGCTAALYSMCVESNGDVLPCQSYYQPLGNILHDPWQTIWNHPLAKSIRAREYASDSCQDCLIFQECGGGCPLHQTAVAHPITQE